MVLKTIFGLNLEWPLKKSKFIFKDRSAIEFEFEHCILCPLHLLQLPFYQSVCNTCASVKERAINKIIFGNIDNKSNQSQLVPGQKRLIYVLLR